MIIVIVILIRCELIVINLRIKINTGNEMKVFKFSRSNSNTPSVYSKINLGAIHKIRPQDKDFANFDTLSHPLRCPQVSGFSLLPPGRLASASIRQHLYCVVNFLRKSGHLIILHFLDE